LHEGPDQLAPSGGYAPDSPAEQGLINCTPNLQRKIGGQKEPYMAVVHSSTTAWSCGNPRFPVESPAITVHNS